MIELKFSDSTRSLWRQAQSLASDITGLSLSPDGLPGRNTARAVIAALEKASETANPAPVADGDSPTEHITPPPAPVEAQALKALDDRSRRNIASCHPKVRLAFAHICLKGKEIAKEKGAGDYVAISGLRTYAEQNALYAMGRTAPGPRVTSVQGGGSYHNFGLAVDFGVFNEDRANYYDSTNPQLAAQVHAAVAKWAKANYPVEWGGDWRSLKDYPHFQMDFGLSTRTLRDRKARGVALV